MNDLSNLNFIYAQIDRTAYQELRFFAEGRSVCEKRFLMIFAEISFSSLPCKPEICHGPSEEGREGRQTFRNKTWLPPSGKSRRRDRASPFFLSSSVDRVTKNNGRVRRVVKNGNATIRFRADRSHSMRYTLGKQWLPLLRITATAIVTF